MKNKNKVLVGREYCKNGYYIDLYESWQGHGQGFGSRKGKVGPNIRDESH